MNSLVEAPRAKKIRFDSENLWVELTDGRQIGVPLAYFPRLSNAKPAQREHYIISGGGTGLHWEEIDEDLSVQGLLTGALHREIPAANAFKPGIASVRRRKSIVPASRLLANRKHPTPATRTSPRTGRTRKLRIGGE